MAIKTVVVNKLTYTDKLGTATFKHVPIAVDAESGITPANFDQEKHDYGLSGDAIDVLNRELAKGWLKKATMQQRTSITREELHGIQLVLGLKAVEFAKVLCLSKAAVSRIYSGSLRVNGPTSRLAIWSLAMEFQFPGFVRSAVEKRRPVKIIEAQLDFQLAVA